jgi:hypothetical protein
MRHVRKPGRVTPQNIRAFATAAHAMQCDKELGILWRQGAAGTPMFIVTILFTIHCYSTMEPLKPSEAWLKSRTDNA